MNFNATALSDKFDNGRCSGTMTVDHGSISFKTPEGILYKLPLNGIEMRIGGAGNRFVFFSHPQTPGISLYTDDRDILKSDEIRFDPELKKVLAKLKNKNRSLWTAAVLILGVLVFAVAAVFIFRGRIVRHLAELIPPQSEQEISESMKQSAIAGKSIVKDSALLKNLEAITTPLLKVVDDTAFKFNFTIIKDESLNAFALPGGAVVIHSGLIMKAQSAEEVAGVLAHEISHVTMRHHIRGIIGNMGIFIIIRGLLGDIAGISGDIATAGATLSSLKYSRDFEYEADDNGYLLLQKARINTAGMISFFETMSKEGPDLGMADFMSTHPATTERIARLKKKKATGVNFQKIDIDFEKFKSDIGKYFNSKQ